jgi:hypothetical protein
VAAVVLACLAAAPGASAEPTPLGLSCEPAADQAGHAGRYCLGRVASFDGVPLDVNVTLPPAGDGPFPLVITLHGFGGSWRDNGLGLPWTARGYAVLNFSARGLAESCGSASSRASGGAGCATGWLHFASLTHEVRDVQYLAGRLADEGIVDGRRIGVTGHSYGGGQSLMLAALRDRAVAPDGSLQPWTSPGGRPMEIAAAAPVVGWSDLAQAFVPNGRALDYMVAPPGESRSPVGVLKQSLIESILKVGDERGYVAPPGGLDPSADLRGWHDKLMAGEPYGPDAEAVLHELAAGHSAYDLPLPRPPAPLLMTQGLGDDFFPGQEAVRYWNRVESQHPSAAMKVLLIQDGHPRGVHDKGFFVIERRIDEWFDHFVKGAVDPPFQGIEMWGAACPASAPMTGPYFAPTWPEIHPGEIRLQSAAAQTVSSAGGDQATANAVVPVEGNVCAVTGSSDAPGTAVYRVPAARAGYTLMGAVTLIADVTVAGEHPQLAARLWDVAPDGSQRLVTRGLYRPTGDGRVVFQLDIAGWRFEPGHVARLELLGRDAPYARASNGEFQLTVSNLDLRLPVRERPRTSGSGRDPDGVVMVGEPEAPPLVPGAQAAPGVVALRLSLSYTSARRRPGGRRPACSWSRAVARVKGSGSGAITRVDFEAAGSRIGRDSRPPYMVKLRPSDLSRSRKLTARVTLSDGRRSTARARLRRCR